jgi:hypothetical protein
MTTPGQPISFKSFRSVTALALISLGLFCFSQVAFAYFEGNHRYDGQSLVNGVDFKLYMAFPENWKLVTTGFSDETEELGLVYANPAAYRHLKNLARGIGDAGYPDGAAFGRVLFKSEKDSRLQTVRRPGAAREYQLMVRGASKFKSTEGWAFARFNAEGLSLAEEPRAMASACVACHTLAKKEGFVFSKLAPIWVETKAKIQPKTD